VISGISEATFDLIVGENFCRSIFQTLAWLKSDLVRIQLGSYEKVLMIEASPGCRIIFFTVR